METVSMPKRLFKLLDPWSIVVIVLTFVLFGLALFIQGFTHGLLLEAGVFLVSLKLILMGYKHNVHSEAMEERLDQIYKILRERQH
jgi:uncharacterized membrane protein